MVKFMVRIALFSLILSLSSYVYAQDKQSYVPNINQGEKLYQSNCSICHGTKGMGDTAASKTMKIKPAALGDPVILNRLSPEKVFDTLTHGISERGMPSYRNLTEKDRWDIAAYLFTLNCNFQKPANEFRPSLNWAQTRVHTDSQIVEILKRRGVPEKYISKELSAARYILE